MGASLSTSAAFPKVKHSAESILFGIDMTKLLKSGETLTGAPTVTKTLTTSPDLSVGGPLVNTSVFANDDGSNVQIGCGIQVRIAAGLTANDYVLTASCATNLGNTRVLVCTLQVRDS